MKILEAVGFTTFNIMMALVLSSTFFNKVEDNVPSASVDSLNESYVTDFIIRMSAMVSGENEETDAYDLAMFLKKHIAENGTFNSTITYNTGQNFGNNEDNEEIMEMDKNNFIQHVMENRKAMQDHESRVSVDYVEISDDQQTASAIITTYERGMMPTVSEFGEDTLVPVSGMSFCEQKFEISQAQMIQIASAACSTDLDFTTDY